MDIDVGGFRVRDDSATLIIKTTNGSHLAQHGEHIVDKFQASGFTGGCIDTADDIIIIHLGRIPILVFGLDHCTSHNGTGLDPDHAF